MRCMILETKEIFHMSRSEKESVWPFQLLYSKDVNEQEILDRFEKEMIR